jgi:LysM repeat protein
MELTVIPRVARRTVPAIGVAAVAIVVAACGGERSYDNPPEVRVPTASSSTTVSTVATTSTTVFVPSTAPTTIAPPTNPPSPTAPPTAPPTFAPQTAPPTQPTIPTSPVPTTGERYTIVQGDTLFGISRKLNVGLPALLSANGMNESSLIIPGQQLAVPQGGSLPPATRPAPQPTAPPAATAAPPPTTAAPAPATTAAPAPPASAARTTTTFASPGGAITPRETAASCQAPNSEEADGTPIVFAPGNVLDHNPATAWRCEASAADKSLTFTFDGPTHLTSVGLIGGYVKVDPLTGVDRFIQNHRVRQVRWTFDDGTVVTQDLADSRDMQSIDVDVTASGVTLTITATYPPGGELPREMVPVAEVQFVGG